MSGRTRQVSEWLGEPLDSVQPAGDRQVRVKSNVVGAGPLGLWCLSAAQQASQYHFIQPSSKLMSLLPVAYPTAMLSMTEKIHWTSLRIGMDHKVGSYRGTGVSRWTRLAWDA